MISPRSFSGGAAEEQPSGVQTREWVGLIYDDAFGLAGFMDAENKNHSAFVLGFCGVYLFKGHFHYITDFTSDVGFTFLNQCYRAFYYGPNSSPGCQCVGKLVLGGMVTRLTITSVFSTLASLAINKFSSFGSSFLFLFDWDELVEVCLHPIKTRPAKNEMNITLTVSGYLGENRRFSSRISATVPDSCRKPLQTFQKSVFLRCGLVPQMQEV